MIDPVWSTTFPGGILLHHPEFKSASASLSVMHGSSPNISAAPPVEGTGGPHSTVSHMYQNLAIRTPTQQSTLTNSLQQEEQKEHQSERGSTVTTPTTMTRLTLLTTHLVTRLTLTQYVVFLLALHGQTLTTTTATISTMRRFWPWRHVGPVTRLLLLLLFGRGHRRARRAR